MICIYLNLYVQVVVLVCSQEKLYHKFLSYTITICFPLLPLPTLSSYTCATCYTTQLTPHYNTKLFFTIHIYVLSIPLYITYYYTIHIYVHSIHTLLQQPFHSLYYILTCYILTLSTTYSTHSFTYTNRQTKRSLLYYTYIILSYYYPNDTFHSYVLSYYIKCIYIYLLPQYIYPITLRQPIQSIPHLKYSF